MYNVQVICILCILNAFLDMDIFSCMDRMNRRRLFGTQQTCLGGTFKEDVGRRFGTLPFKVWFGMVGIDGCCNQQRVVLG